jgi:hypothetical protein
MEVEILFLMAVCLGKKDWNGQPDPFLLCLGSERQQNGKRPII